VNSWAKSLGQSLALLLVIAGSGRAAWADGLYVVQTLRAGGCGGVAPSAAGLQKNTTLDQAAAHWAGGQTVDAAIEHSGYHAQQWATLHYRGSDNQAFQQLRNGGCRNVLGATLRDVGVFHQGEDTWLVMAAPGHDTGSAAASTAPRTTAAVATPLIVAPAHAPAPVTHVTAAPAPIDASRVLQLVNAARAHGALCGTRSFAPVGPVHLSEQLADVAFGHATDMAEHNYFEHEDLQGHTPADRVKAAGYAEKLVGENIAYGPTSADEVVQGWLDSPGHCENIMDPRFAEMGIAYAPGRVQRHGLYWVQLLVAPRV
jgi:uncharacterized protein YkwD